MNFSVIVAIISLLCCTNVLVAQNARVALTAYSNFIYSDETQKSWHTQGIEITSGRGTCGYFSPALILYNPHGNFHEFEISRFAFNTKDALIFAVDSTKPISSLVSGTNIREINFALRYSYSFLLDIFQEDSKFQIYLGVAGSPYYIRESLTPFTSDIFPISWSEAGIRFSAIPTMNYSIKENWFLSLNIPLTIANSYYTSTKSENPTLPVSKREVDNLDIKLFPNELHIRFGIGLKI